MKHNKTGDKYLSEVKKADIIKQFEELGYLVTPIKDAKETFADYFSNMDMNGLDSLLTNKHKYDGDTKEYYLNLINKEFEGFKSHNVHYLCCGNQVGDCAVRVPVRHRNCPVHRERGTPRQRPLRG